MKPLHLLILGSLIFTTHLFAGPESFLERGFVQNDSGDKCWYTQRVDAGSTYFHGSLTSTTGIMTFDDPSCMGDSGVGLDTNKMMINNVISRWYSHSDANFKTRASELYSGSMLQTRGRCMQSGKYSTVGITVDYVFQNNAITRVYHGPSVQGCTN